MFWKPPHRPKKCFEMLFKHCNALPSTSTTPSLKLAKASFDVLPNLQATENHAICMASLHFLLLSVPHSRPCYSGATTNSSAPHWQARSGAEGHSAGASARLISCSGHGIDPRVPTRHQLEQVRPDLGDLVTKSSRLVQTPSASEIARVRQRAVRPIGILSRLPILGRTKSSMEQFCNSTCCNDFRNLKTLHILFK